MAFKAGAAPASFPSPFCELRRQREKGMYPSAPQGLFGCANASVLRSHDACSLAHLLRSGQAPLNERRPTRREGVWGDFLVNMPVDKSAHVATASSSSTRPHLASRSECLAAAAAPVTLIHGGKKWEKTVTACRFDGSQATAFEWSTSYR